MKVKEESERVGLKFNSQKTKIMAPVPIISWQINGETVADFIFRGSKITADDDYSHEIKRRLLLGRKVVTKLDSLIKSREIRKVYLVKAMFFFNGHVWMWELDHKQSWAPKNWCFWTVVLEKTLESPLDCKEIQPVHPKGDQSWIFIWFRLVQFICSLVSDSLQHHGLQHTRLPCPSPTPGAYPNSCQMSQWCHPTILSAIPFSSCLQFSTASGLSQWVSSLQHVAKVLGLW